MRLSAAAAGAAALSPVFKLSAHAREEAPRSIAIIGGGVAGLTAAYRLQAAGAKPVVFEASNRWGGRIFTQYDFYKGMFCELGGEFVDTNHEDLQKLCAELGVEMQKLAVEGEGEDLYFFSGKFHTPKDMLDPEKQSGAFVPIAKQIAEDAEKLTDDEENWTEYAGKLDQMSLKAYLEQFRGKTDDWAIDLLDVGYNIEFGLETEDQSSLNMVDFIGTDLSEPFQMFGESDEVFRIKGGSSALIKALLAALENKIEMRLGQRACGARRQGRADRRELRCARRRDHSETFDAVILALPFTRLRQVKGLESLDLGEEKLKTIRELGYGTVPRFCLAPPRACGGVPSVGTSRHHPMAPSIPISASRICGTRAATSLATLASSPTSLAAKLAWPTRESAIEAFRDGLPKMSPKMAESLDPAAVMVWFWATYPYALGSYASAKPGQYTTMLEVAGEPALDGRLQFAGEHTSSDFLGYMNGGVLSGNRAAAALIETMAAAKMSVRSRCGLLEQMRDSGFPVALRTVLE